MKIFIIVITMLAIAGVAQAVLTATETFTYAPGNAWIGTGQPWHAEGIKASFSTVAGDLPTLIGQYSQPEGNHFLQDTSASTFSRYNHIYRNGGSEITNGVRYDSFSLRLGDITSLATDTNEYGEDLGIVGFDTYKYHMLVVRKDVSDPTRVNLGYWGAGSNRFHAQFVWDTTRYNPTQDIFIVVKNSEVNELASPWTGSRLSFYINPGPVSEAVAPIAFSGDMLKSAVLDKMLLRQHRTVNYEVDNWLVGTDWEDVVFIPEPVAFGLLGLGVLAFIRRR